MVVPRTWLSRITLIKNSNASLTASARQQQENAIATSDTWMKELLEVRGALNEILVQISSIRGEDNK